MLYSFIATAATLLSMTSSVMAVGTARVVNNCGSTVYYAAVAANGNAGMAPLPAGGFSEQYSQSDIGISIKVSPSATGPVSQFEFTWANGDIAYDISNIDGNPFALGGMTLTPSAAATSDYPTCLPVTCPAGAVTCTAAYNNPDDVKTMVCPDSSDLTFVLCSGGSNKRDEPSFFSRIHARQWA